MRFPVMVSGLLCAAAAAQAAPITYDFSGRLEFVDPRSASGFHQGQHIAIQIVIDDAVPADADGRGASGGSFLYNPYAPYLLFTSVTFGGDDHTDSGFQGYDYDATGIHFDTVGRPATGFSLDLLGPAPGALPPSGYPSSLDPSLFQTGTFEVYETFNLPPQYRLLIGYSGFIDGVGGSAVEVPEPASAGFLLAGLAGINTLRTLARSGANARRRSSAR